MPLLENHLNCNLRQTRSSSRRTKQQIKTNTANTNCDVQYKQSFTKNVEESVISDDSDVEIKYDSTCKSKLEKQKIKRYNKYEENTVNAEVMSKNDENKFRTPRKNKSTNEIEINSVTPPKQKRQIAEDTLKSPSTPSSLLMKLNITSSKIKCVDEEKLGPKKLFGEKNIYQNARRALHSTFPVHLPGRENKLLELKKFITEHLNEEKSGTLYISGPPGTGKTASLSIILNDPEVELQFKKIYVNCTSIKSSGSIFSRIVKELNIKKVGKTEKDYLHAIENYLSKTDKIILLVLDEIDQLESKNQSVLYTIFEWPSRPNFQIILIGIANALDLTDRILPRLQARCELKPKLMHFAPYTKEEIVTIFMERLKEADVSHVFAPVALQMLAGKVAAISGDVRRALDIGRRVIELVEQNKKLDVLKSLENLDTDNDVKPLEDKAVELIQVVNVLNNIYGTINKLNNEEEDALPLQQKIILCTLLLILKNSKNKDITIGKLHEVYRKVCSKRNILAVDQSEFVGLCSLIESRGIIRVAGKKEPRLHKVHLEWDQEEVTAVLKDKKLLSVILQDDFCLGKM